MLGFAVILFLVLLKLVKYLESGKGLFSKGLMLMTPKKKITFNHSDVGVIEMSNITTDNIESPSLILTKEAEWAEPPPQVIRPSQMETFKIKSTLEPSLIGFCYRTKNGRIIFTSHDGTSLPYSMDSIPDDYCILFNFALPYPGAGGQSFV